MSTPAHESSLFASLRRLLATALEIAQVRLELLSNEVEVEKRRIIDGLFWGAVALMILGVGLVLLCGFVLLLFWDSYRLPAVGLMALIFLAGGALLIRDVQQKLRRPGGVFKASATELERDRAGLSNQHEPR